MSKLCICDLCTSLVDLEFATFDHWRNGANTHRHPVDKCCQCRGKFGARMPIDRADGVSSIHVLKRRLKGVRESMILFCRPQVKIIWRRSLHSGPLSYLKMKFR